MTFLVHVTQYFEIILNLFMKKNSPPPTKGPTGTGADIESDCNPAVEVGII